MKGVIIGIVAASVLVLSGFVTQPVNAATTPDRSLSISPLRKELEITAGTSYTGSFELTNKGKTHLDVTFSAELFSVINQAYDYSFNPKGLAAKWVTFTPQSATLQPDETQTISYSVGVPNNAEPGGRYISLFATSQANITGSIIPVQRLGSLLYITIPGNVSRTGVLLSLRSPSIAFDNNASWSASIQNTGTAHFRSTYSSRVFSLFNQQINEGQATALILPNSVRLVSSPIPNLQWIGIYRVEYTVSLGDNASVTKSYIILYVPLLQLFILLVIASVTFIVIKKIRQHMRTKKMSEKTN